MLGYTQRSFAKLSNNGLNFAISINSTCSCLTRLFQGPWHKIDRPTLDVHSFETHEPVPRTHAFVDGRRQAFLFFKVSRSHLWVWNRKLGRFDCRCFELIYGGCLSASIEDGTGKHRAITFIRVLKTSACPVTLKKIFWLRANWWKRCSSS